MKKKNREITVFSISALDLFCSAMGVFMILCFILFPSYNKTANSQPQQPPLPNPTKPKVIPSLTVTLHWEHHLQELGGTPYWSSTSSDDIDLIVLAPSESNPNKTLRYDREQKSHPESQAIFLVDSLRGGGEAWLHPKVTPGQYKVLYTIARKDSERLMTFNGKYGTGSSFYKLKAIRIIVTVVSHDGIIGGTDDKNGKLQPIVIPIDDFKADKNKSELIATITVSEDGSITVN